MIVANPTANPANTADFLENSLPFGDWTMPNGDLPERVAQVLQNAASITIPDNREELARLALGDTDQDRFDVEYDLPGFPTFARVEDEAEPIHEILT